MFNFLVVFFFFTVSYNFKELVYNALRVEKINVQYTVYIVQPA